ncbi:MAG TPA: methyltransferase domain-containing protein, partial [Methylomirabilota bacterium]|nr:methyltransferase domain-containing protein [Methylomirabilota bacterium]
LLKNPYRRLEHISGLREFYTIASDLINEQRWPEPLATPTPQVLQIGTAGYLTSETFVTFVHEKNRQARVYISDLSEKPLADCRTHGLEQSNVMIMQADTTHFQFPPNFFDLIETDALLQFLPPAEKQQAIKEWFRVLKPGGVATTRDWFIPNRSTPGELEAYEKRRHIVKEQFGVLPEKTTTEEIFHLLKTAGFSLTVKQDSSLEPGKFFLHIAARKPEK